MSSSILVVEHEGRYIERIQDALSSEGWNPRFVAGRPEALRAAASEQPGLVLVNSDLPGAPELLRAFAHRNGGPGAVALVPERESDRTAAELGADDILFKPFTDQELRLMVRRGLSGQLGGDGGAAGGGEVSLEVPEELAPPAAGDAPEPAPETPQPAAAPPATDPEAKFSSQDIFGDLLAEVEQEVRGGPAAGGDAGEPTTPPEARSGDTPPQSPPAGAAEPPEPRKRAATEDDPELARRIEKTLSGVLDPKPRRPKPPAEQTPAAAAPGGSAAGEPPEPTPPPRKRRRRRADADVDELLNLTLSSLEDRPRRPEKKAPEKTAPEGRDEALFADLDLSELDSLAATGRRRRTAARDTPAAAPAEPAAAPAEEVAPEAAVPDDAGDASWADVAEALEEGDGSSEVQPPPDLAPEAEPAPAPPPAATGSEGSGDTFGPYTLEDRIAVGGMAEVWKARMSGVEGFQKTVAIKKILPQMTDSSDFVNMFIDEAKLAAQLNHPNITHIYDLGKIGRDYYIAMEFVDGPNLRSVLNQARRKGVPLPVGLALLVGARLASALDYAHRKRDFDGRRLELVHRDVSPQNVLLSYEGDIKLCDFGIVKAVTKASHTEMGALKGKLQYMSPEQAWGRQVDARSDIFSLGALLFEMLTGERLFAGDSEISVLDAVRECHVRSPRELNPAVPERAEEVVLRALAEKPEDRYDSAGDLQHDLERILYQLRPAPSQADLAGWLRELEGAGELDEAQRRTFSWAEAVSAPVMGEPGGETAAPAAREPREGGPAEQAPAVQEPAEPPAEPEPDDGAPPAEPSGASVLPADDEPVGAVTQPLPAFEQAPELPEVEPPAEEEPAAAEPPAVPPPSAAAAGGDEAAAVDVMTPPEEGELEIEEGGRRGLWLLIILMLLAILTGLVWYFVFGPGADELGFDVTPLGASAPAPAAGEPAPADAEPPVPDPAAPEAAEPGDSPEERGGDSPEGAAAVPDGGDGNPGGQAVEAGQGSGVSMTDLEAIVDEQMARKEEEIRRQKEEELRRLEAELARVRQESDSEREDAATGDDGGGDGR